MLLVYGPELDQPLAKAAPPMTTTVGGLLAGLRGSPPDWSVAAAGALAEAFRSSKDRRLFPEFHKIANAVAVGSFGAEVLLDAYSQATKSSVEKPGAVSNLAIKSHG